LISLPRFRPIARSAAAIASAARSASLVSTIRI
jgi:hypothetical protein